MSDQPVPVVQDPGQLQLLTEAIDRLTEALVATADHLTLAGVGVHAAERTLRAAGDAVESIVRHHLGPESSSPRVAP